jgi:DNA-directed RNA polymerase specialized sigma24 family protein
VLSQGSITGLLGGMKRGDADAARLIWERYSTRLAALARERLPACLHSVVDGDDVANSAFHSFVVGAREGRFPCLADRDGLWRLLACITVRKALDEIQSAGRQKRTPPGAQVALSEEIASPAPPPDLEVIAAEQFQILMERLRFKEEILKQIALWKFEGHTHEEIARRLGCSCRKIVRKLEVIRLTWQAEEPL